MEHTLNSIGPAGDDRDEERRRWLLLTGMAGGVAAVGTAVPLVSSLAPSERAKAAGGSVEVDIASIPPGGSTTVEWRGKPVWIVRRTADMVAALAGHDADLVDPQSRREQQPPYAANAARSVRDDVFVAVGICTHLGCSPSAVPKGASHAGVAPAGAGGV
jgi:ubiquinol-cytochrome c reductase iron-sulfur subunit